MEKVELTNMCMIYDNNGNVLVQERNKNWKGIAFPGGHVDKGESLVASTIREIFEETGLTISNLELCGIKNWYDHDKDYRYMVFLYKTNQFKGELTEFCNEGRNFWMPFNKLKKTQLSSSFDVSIDVIYGSEATELFYEYIENQWVKKVY